MRKANDWFGRQPLWRQVPIMFIEFGLIWTLVVYIAAWSTGGVTSGDLGFPNGELSVGILLEAAAFQTAIYFLVRLWKRRHHPRQRDGRRGSSRY